MPSDSLLSVSFAYRRGIMSTFLPSSSIPVTASLASLSKRDSSYPPLPYADAVPLELWDNVFSFMSHEDQISVRTVSPMWCNLLSRRTHEYIVLAFPDRRDIVENAQADRDDTTFLRKLALEYEIDLRAAIVRRKLKCIVKGVRLINWPVFYYNFFLHLLECVETVSIEGPGTRWGQCFPPRIPCPFLLPPTVKELRLSRVTFRGYSLEGMLAPDGQLERLVIESIEDGGLVRRYALLPCTSRMLITLLYRVTFLISLVCLLLSHREPGSGCHLR